MVAKSYQNLETVGEVYMCNAKNYIKVRLKNGTIKQVRFYTDAEYRRMYPEAKMNALSPDRKTQKEVLGFEKGYITIFKGDTYGCKEWFNRSIARYCKWWGWYIISTQELPEDMPTTIIPVQLSWELVGEENGNLKPDSVIAKAIEPLLYEASPSEFVGSIGERLELTLTVKRAIEVSSNFNDCAIMHIMEDENQNIFVWATTAKNWREGSVHKLRGTVKDHRTFRNCKQTVLSRCLEV